MAVVMSGTDDIGAPLGKSIVAGRSGGDEFEFLFFEHYERVLRLLMRMTGDRARAEELGNEVFWKLSRRPASWLLTHDVGPWLYRTAMNAGIDAFRAAYKRARYERSAAGEAHYSSVEQGPLEDLLREESRTRVQQVLSQMKPERAQLLLMRSCGSPYKELAESLGVPVGNIGTLLNRAEEEFRKRYLILMAKEKAK